MAYILALIVGLGSVGLYMAAFFFPEVYRKNDFVLSGLGMFYALVLWVCAGRITGGVLLGQVASVTLLGWLSWQGLEMRRSLTPVDQQTRLPGSARTLGDVLRKSAQELPGQLQQQVNRLSLPAAFGRLTKRATQIMGATPKRSPKQILKQLQDGDRTLQSRTQKSTVQEPSVRKPSTKPAKKRPVKQVNPPVEDAIAPAPQTIASQTTVPQTTAPDPQVTVPPAIAPLPVDAASPSDLSISPAIASEPLLNEPPADSTAAPSFQAEPEPLLSTTAVPATAPDDDFGFDDELIPTRATAAELRELTIQSKASRRPNWFTNLKQRLQKGRNAGKRSPQTGSPQASSLPTSPLNPMVPAVEAVPEPNLNINLDLNLNTNLNTNPETNPKTETLQETGQSISPTVLRQDLQDAPEAESTALTQPVLQPDINPEQPNDPTAFTPEILEAVEAIAATVEAETLMTSPEEDWDLGWMEESEPSEIVAAVEFEGTGFPEPDGSVTITVEAETIPTIETDSESDVASATASDSAAEAEWDLGWAGEVLAADSATEAVMNSEMDAVTDSGMNSVMDSGVEFTAELLEESRTDDWAEAEAEFEAEAPQANWEDWEETNLDESSSALPLFIEEDIELLSTESNWLDAEIIPPSPDLLELLEEDTEAIAFPTEDFSELLSDTAEPGAIEDMEAIAPVEQIEALAQLSEEIAPPLDPDESPIVIDETQHAVDESLSLVDESLILVDEPQSVSNESLIVMDESLILVDESLSLVDESLILVDKTLIVVDETQRVVDESLIIADEKLSEEFGLTEPETIVEEQTGFDNDNDGDSVENFGEVVDTDPEVPPAEAIPSEPPDDSSTVLPVSSTGRGLTIQIVKLEASEAESEPLSESDSEES